MMGDKKLRCSTRFLAGFSAGFSAGVVGGVAAELTVGLTSVPAARCFWTAFDPAWCTSRKPSVGGITS